MAIEQNNARIPVEHLLYGKGLEVLTAILQKQHLTQIGDREAAAKIRTLVYFDGGGHGVSTQIGWGKVMHMLGLFENGIDILIGASGGSVVSNHSAVGNYETTEVFEENCQNGFAGCGNVREGKRGVSFKKFGETLRRFPLIKEKLQEVGAEVYTVVTHAKTGERKAFDMKRVKDPEAIIHASCLIPEVGDMPYVEIDGEPYVDGAMGGVPHEIIDAFQPTHVLILSCYPIEKTSRQKLVEDVFHAAGQRMGATRRALLGSGRDGRRAISEVFLRHWTTDVAYAIAAPEEVAVSTFTMDIAKINQAMEDSYDSASHHFSLATRNLTEEMQQAVPVIYRGE